MQNEELPLRDIHLPEALSWWPPAPGWWIMPAALVLLGIGIYLYSRFRKRGQLKRDTLNELAKIHDHFHQNHNTLLLVKALSTLIRRASISFYPRKDTASLTGAAWLQHLDNTSDTDAFANGRGRLLATAPYLPHNGRVDVDGDELIALCKQWLERQPIRRAVK